jgi:hypothetical protein
MINTFQLKSFEIFVYPTFPKENLELYFLFLDWVLGSVRCCESSFYVLGNHDNFSHIKLHVISESPAAIHTYSASSWQAVSTKVFPCFQLLVEGACRQVEFSEGRS